MQQFAGMCLTAALVAPALAQDPPKPARQDEKVAVGTVEVLLDVVVKDKRGRAVTDLSGADFEVFEDGMKQPVESFRLITHKSAGESGNVDSAVPDKAPAPPPAKAPANATPPSPTKPVLTSNP